MIKHNTARFITVTLVTSFATWLVGWWAVPVVAFAAGWALTPAWITGCAAALAWALLLANGEVTRLAAVLAGVMGLPAAVIIALTVLFPMLLGWSAAAVGTALRSVRGSDDPTGHMSRAP